MGWDYTKRKSATYSTTTPTVLLRRRGFAFRLPFHYRGCHRLPGNAGNGPAVPLWIHDAHNACETVLGDVMTTFPAQTARLNPMFIGIDGDKGPPPATGCAAP